MKRGRPYDGIPTAEEEALQPPDWDPVDSSVAFLTGGSSLAPRLAAAGTDIAAQGMMNSSLPSWVSYPASLALGLYAGRMVPDDAVPGGMAAKYLDAWHTSPHKFDRFDSSRIGSGYGEQANGYGLYFSDNMHVSGLPPRGQRPGFHRDLGPNGPVFPSVYDRGFQSDALLRDEDAWTTAVKRIGKSTPEELEKSLGFTEHKQRGDGQSLEDWITHRLSPVVIDDLRRGNPTDPDKRALQPLYDFWKSRKPSIYQVRLHKPPESFLNLDESVTEDLLNKLGRGVAEAFDIDKDFDDYTNKHILKELEEWHIQTAFPESFHLAHRGTRPDQRAAAFLTSRGIPGVSYGDRQIDYARNYVMFPGNDDAIEIIKRYGLPLTLMGASAAGTQEQE